MLKAFLLSANLYQFKHLGLSKVKRLGSRLSPQRGKLRITKQRIEDPHLIAHVEVFPVFAESLTFCSRQENSAEIENLNNVTPSGF